MKKLEDIPKNEVFRVPEGYFEGLPSKIQARIESQRPVRETSFIFRYKLQYAIPVLVLLAIGIYWFAVSTQPKNAEAILASVPTEDLVAYLHQSDLSTEDLLENAAFNSGDVEDIESEVYELDLGLEELDEELGDIDLDNI